MHLPAYVQYGAETTTELMIQMAAKLNEVRDSALKVNFSSKDLTSEVIIEIALGSTCSFLLLVILALSLTIWLQKKQIKRLLVFFHGQRIDEDRRPIFINNNNDTNDTGDADENFQDAVHNPNFIHQNHNVNNVVTLIFPNIVPGFRNLTAFREFQKNQRLALKQYQDHQKQIFVPRPEAI
jgi:hypothetical protein